ncbi:MAG: SDR family oxidoreductase [Rhodospirillales bacterium]|nr:SDR family oxidoreductase [Alphaproteobacteria bacterium]MBL6948555.1 SDR family oxidoreductase [Rhodospirillales bacterium]
MTASETRPESSQEKGKETDKRFFCFGLGYSAGRLARALLSDGWSAAGTCQSEERRAELAADGIEAHVFDVDTRLSDAAELLSGVTHLLSSVPPPRDGGGEEGDRDPVLALYAENIRAAEHIQWIGYLSSTGVYGDAGGGRVDETTPVNPSSERSRMRAEAEAEWLALGAHVFRLAGIYGPGRSALDQVRAGRARRIEKPGHKFSRIHVDDIAAVVRASMDRPDPGAIYNVCDDEAASPADVNAFAYELLGQEAPPVTAFEDIVKTMSPMGLSFWQDNRLVDNSRIKEALGVRLAYPDYRAGLRAILAEGA